MMQRWEARLSQRADRQQEHDIDDWYTEPADTPEFRERQRAARYEAYASMRRTHDIPVHCPSGKDGEPIIHEPRGLVVDK